MTRRSNDDEEREDRIRVIMERARRLQERAPKAKKPKPVTTKAKKSSDREPLFADQQLPRHAAGSVGVCSAAVRVDAPLPGDLVIRCRDDELLLRRGEVFVITHWPDADTIVAGPYQSYGYALRQAQGMLRDRSERIWYDHAPAARTEQLEQVGGHGHS